MKNRIINWVWHLVIIIGFLFLTVAYFSPAFEGKELIQNDVITGKALFHQTKQILDTTGHYSLWTNAVFSGMPTYTFGLRDKTNLFEYIKKLVHILPYRSASMFFMYLLGFYLLMLAFRIDKWLSAILAVAFAFSSYNIIIIAVGHIIKAYAIAYMPMVLASFVLLYDHKKYFWGTVALAISLGLQISTHHVQIVYYTGMLVGLYVIYKLIVDRKQLRHWTLATILAIAGTILAILPNTVSLWTTYEQTKYSIRGGHSELIQGKKVKGLEKNYALSWSYGVGESLTLLVPNAKGGASEPLAKYPKILSKINSPYIQDIAKNSAYFGPQQFTSGPVYFGVVIMFLFILGFFIVRSNLKWWVLAAFLLSLMLSWGRHFPLLTDLFYYYVPLYNKFRTVSMILVIAELVVPLWAGITLYEIAKNPSIIREKRTGFLITLGITAGISLLLYLFPGIMGPFLRPEESALLQNIAASNNPELINAYRQVFDGVKEARMLLVKADAFRSFILIVISAAFLWFYPLLKKNYILYVGTLLLILIDLVTIDTRYLSYDDFVNKYTYKNIFVEKPVDKFILKTKEKNFRVLNLTTNPFTDAITSYFHQSIGGYSAAKLRRYQDIIDSNLTREINLIIRTLQDTAQRSNLMQVLRTTQTINALNTLYIIVNPNTAPIVNPFAFGNAWFVNGYRFVNSPVEEFRALNNVDLRKYAVIDKSKYPDVKFPTLSLIPDSTRSIELVFYLPDSLVYKTHSNNTEFVVFSEIYYPEGWQAYIDGKPAKIINVDYILRGLIVPPGDHTIVMVFKPKSYYLGRKIALIGSIIIILLIIIGIVMEIRSSKTKKE